MNLSSLYRAKLTKDAVLKYTNSIIGIMGLRLTDKISKEEMSDRLEEAINKFLKRYGG